MWLQCACLQSGLIKSGADVIGGGETSCVNSNTAVQTLYNQANRVHMQYTKQAHDTAATVSHPLHWGKPACRFVIPKLSIVHATTGRVACFNLTCKDVECTMHGQHETHRKACSSAVTFTPVMGAVLKSSEESAKASKPWVAGAATYS